MVNSTFDRPRQNKANSPIADCGLRNGYGRTAARPASLRRGQLYKQTQFPGAGKKRQVLGGKGLMVNSTFDGPRQNKANLGKPGWDPGSRFCETNPIRWRIMRNKPNSSIADCRLPRFARNDMLRIGDRPAASGPRGRLCDIASMPHFGKQSQLPEIEPKRWMWNPPRYAGHTPSGQRSTLFSLCGPKPGTIIPQVTDMVFLMERSTRWHRN
jgi:hypothetical protein